MGGFRAALFDLVMYKLAFYYSVAFESLYKPSDRSFIMEMCITGNEARVFGKDAG